MLAQSGGALPQTLTAGGARHGAGGVASDSGQSQDRAGGVLGPHVSPALSASAPHPHLREAPLQLLTPSGRHAALLWVFSLPTSDILGPTFIF